MCLSLLCSVRAWEYIIPGLNTGAHGLKKKRMLPLPKKGMGLETQKSWTLFWDLLGSSRSWTEQSNGQDEMGFVYSVKVQWNFTISDFRRLCFLFKWILKLPLLKMFASANTFLQLYYWFPTHGLSSILGYNTRKKKPLKCMQQNENPCSSNSSRNKGTIQVCIQLRKSIQSVPDPHQWDSSVQCLLRDGCVVKLMELWKLS